MGKSSNRKTKKAVKVASASKDKNLKHNPSPIVQSSSRSGTSNTTNNKNDSNSSNNTIIPSSTRRVRVKGGGGGRILSKALKKKTKDLRKQQMILSTLKLRKREEASRRIDGLDIVKEALDEIIIEQRLPAPSQPTARPEGNRSNRAKRTLATDEVRRVELVWQHPSFQRDPFETMREHLRNTMADQKQQQQQRGVIVPQKNKKREGLPGVRRGKATK